MYEGSLDSPRHAMTIEKICKADCTKNDNRRKLMNRVNRICKTQKFDLVKVTRGIGVLAKRTGMGSVVCTSYPKDDRLVFSASLHDVKKEKVVCTAIALDFEELMAKMLLVLLEISKQ